MHTRRTVLHTTGLLSAAYLLQAASCTTQNGTSTLTVDVAAVDAWGQALINAASLIAPLVSPVAGAAVAAFGPMLSADLTAFDKAANGQISLTFTAATMPAALRSLLADGQSLLQDAAGPVQASNSTQAKTYLTAAETIVALIRSALGATTVGAAAGGRMTEGEALMALQVR